MNEIISIWKNVSIEITKQYHPSGELRLVVCDSNYYFYWIPDITTNTSNYDIDPGHLSFVIELYQVQTIYGDLKEAGVGFLNISLKDNSIFPKLIFNDFGNLAITLIIHYLVSQKLASFIVEEKINFISVNSQHQSKFDIPEDAINSSRFITIVEQWKVLEKFGAHQKIHQFDPVSDSDLPNLKMECFKCGISPEMRCVIWPKLLNVKRGNQFNLSKESLTRLQKIEFDIILEKINTRAKYLDRDEKQINLVIEILTLYTLYNINLVSPEGLIEIVDILMDVFIKNINDDEIEMRDGQKLPYDEGRAYIFEIFCKFLHKNSHFRILINDQQYNSFLEKIFTIIQTISKPATEKITVFDLDDFIFLCKSIYLLYARDFEQDKVLRLWDSIISIDENFYFPLFFHSAVCILLFNPMFMNSQINKGDMIMAAENIKQTLNVNIPIKMAYNLHEEIVKQKGEEWVLQILNDQNKISNYHPKYLPISDE